MSPFAKNIKFYLFYIGKGNKGRQPIMSPLPHRGNYSVGSHNSMFYED